MKNKLILGAAAALATAGLTVISLTGCGQGPMSATSSASGANSSAMVVTVGDAPLSNILSAKVTVSSISLTPSSGTSDVTVLSQARTIELSSLGAIEEPIETENVPAGTYKAVNVTVSSAKVTYVNSSGQVVTGTATLNQPKDSVTLKPALVVTQGQDVQMRLNFNLAQSFDLSGSTLTFTPSISSAAASIANESEADREVEVTGSVVAISSSSITVKSADTGVQSKFAINSSTRFSANVSASTIKQGSIVTVHGTVQPDGSLLATMISAAMNGDAMDSSQGGGQGIVTAVTTGSGGAVTSFTFVPREDFGDMSSSATMSVSLSSSTMYGVGEDASQQGISSTAFTNAEIFPGQSVEVIGTTSGSGTIAAQEVDLGAESLSGTLGAAPMGTAPNFTFTLQLPTASYLTTYDSLTSVDAGTTKQTQYEDGLTASSFASLTSGASLEVHGYLLRDSTGNVTLTVADVSKGETEGTNN